MGLGVGVGVFVLQVLFIIIIFQNTILYYSRTYSQVTDNNEWHRLG